MRDFVKEYEEEQRRAEVAQKKTVTVSSIAEYVKLVLEISANLKSDIIYDKQLLYRGQSDSAYKVIPSLGRCTNSSKNAQIGMFERKMIEATINKHPSLFGRELYPIDLLAKLQHYGIPTRLLDVTANPLVALFFACNKSQEKTGEVIVFKDSHSDIIYPIINAIADSYRFAFTSITDLTGFYEQVIRQPYFLEQRHTVEILHDNSEMGANWVNECYQNPFFISALEWSERQKAQKGKYILFPNEISCGEEVKYFIDGLAVIHKDAPFIEKLIHIDKSKKHQFINELSALGISESSLFPDNIDLSCKEIADKQIKRI